MEPRIVTMTREAGKNKDMTSTERFPGDGMEIPSIESYVKNSSISYKSYNRKHMHPSPLDSKHQVNLSDSLSDTSETSIFKTPSNSLLTTYTTPNQTLLERPSYDETLRNISELSVENDTLKTQMELYRQMNDKLTEEKMRLSQQLGVQTQVNNEVKRLLVASIGEDLEEKYERLILDKAQIDLELKHLQNLMDEDREEVEQAMIQADVWRSKFLASRVMSEELARWKSILYYKYKDSHTALQHLLNEHSRMRCLNNATHRGLVRFAEILNCKDPSLDSKKPLTTLDVSFMNADLVESLVTVMEYNKDTVVEESEQGDGDKEGKQRIAIEETFLQKERTKNTKNKDVYVEASELTPAEQLAQEIVLNPEIQSEELTRMRNDYLAHNRISHFLSTNYNATYNCCAFCTGPVYIV